MWKSSGWRRWTKPLMWTVPPPTHAAIQLSTDFVGRAPFHWCTRGSASTPRRQKSRRHSRISSGEKSFSVYQGPFSRHDDGRARVRERPGHRPAAGAAPDDAHVDRLARIVGLHRGHTIPKAVPGLGVLVGAVARGPEPAFEREREHELEPTGSGEVRDGDVVLLEPAEQRVLIGRGELRERVRLLPSVLRPRGERGPFATKGFTFENIGASSSRIDEVRHARFPGARQRSRASPEGDESQTAVSVVGSKPSPLRVPARPGWFSSPRHPASARIAVTFAADQTKSASIHRGGRHGRRP
jgi:hypothetical protein